MAEYPVELLRQLWDYTSSMPVGRPLDGEGPLAKWFDNGRELRMEIRRFLYDVEEL